MIPLPFLGTLLSDRAQRRHTWRWVRARAWGNGLAARLPWLTFDAQDFIAGRLRTAPRVFEYGSGGSTLYWLDRGATCVSVEHDEAWHARVLDYVGPCASLDYRLVLPEASSPGSPGDISDPTAYRSSGPEYLGKTFRAYASLIDAFPDGTFDLVLIDGRARPSCLHHASPKVRPGGLLVLDDAERPHYLARTGGLLAAFEAHSFPGTGPFADQMWRTDVYVRSA